MWQGAGAVSMQCFGECLCLWRCCSEQASAGSVLTSFTAFWGIFTQTQQNDLKKKSEREIKKKMQLLWHMLKIPKSFGLKCAKRKKITNPVNREVNSLLPPVCSSTVEHGSFAG